jgi:putative ABC transport system substrate-binding protein
MHAKTWTQFSDNRKSKIQDQKWVRIFAIALTFVFGEVVASAQQPKKIARIGYVFGSTAPATMHTIEAFRQRMQELGYIEGKSYTLELRYGEAKTERFPEIARELVGLKMDVIVAATDVAIAAVRRETQTIPIVMAISTDPVGTGFVASLAHPGGNVTGLSVISPTLSGKRLELLREVVPGLSRLAFLWNPDLRGAVLDYKETESAAGSLRLQIQSVELVRAEELNHALSAVAKERAQALLVPPLNPVAFSNRAHIVSFARNNKLPSMYAQKEFVEAGGLMSYGSSTADMHR